MFVRLVLVEKFSVVCGNTPLSERQPRKGIDTSFATFRLNAQSDSVCLGSITAKQS